MALENLGSGSVITDDVRTALEDAGLPDETHFVVRASHDGPLALTTLAVNGSLLVDPPIRADEGWISFQIDQPLTVGDRLVWSVLASFAVPVLAAYLVTNGNLHFLRRKEDLAAGGLWATGLILRSFHLD